jgi:two-component system sensor histidine kinase RegB
MTTTGQTPLWTSLRRLAWIRVFAVGTLSLGLSAVYIRGISVEFAPLAGAIVLLALAGALTFIRLRRSRTVTEWELFGQLLVDVAALGWILYYTGGATSPLAGFYALLVLYACSTLRARLLWALAGICVASYMVLECYHAPLPEWHSRVLDPTLESLTSRITYLLLVVMAAWFGVRMGDLRREQQSHASEHAEKEAGERYLLGLATLCAGTAHEMSTPLTTAGLLLADLRRSPTPPPDWKQSIDLLWQQIQTCKRSLAELALAANIERLGKLRRVSAKGFVYAVAERFQQVRPSVKLTVRRIRIDDSFALDSDDTLSQALINVLNNAADASPDWVELRAARKNGVLVLHVLDRGPGVAPKLRERLSKGPVTTKAPGRGSGAGLLIARAVIGRFRGTVHMYDRTNGGTCVQIELPITTSVEEIDHGYREPRTASG